MKKCFKISVILFLIAFVLILAINFYVLTFSKVNYYYNVNGLDKKYVGLVFGASVIGNKTPSDILKDRLKVVYSAYKLGKIEKIIVSGDNSHLSYNEPVAMQKFLINIGVDQDDIYLDYAGFDTYDSLYRAREIFSVNEIVLFTQDFHLKRAMYIASKLGLDSYGVETNLQKYRSEDYNNFREIFARIKAFLEVEIFTPEPRFLGDKVDIISDEEIHEVKRELFKK